MARIKRQGQGRIIGALSDSKPLQAIKAATPDQIPAMKAAGWAGWKWHCQPAFNGGTKAAHPLYDDPYFTPYYRAMEAAQFPLVCLHFGAPLGNGKQQRDALRRVMDRHPDLIVIQAHFGAARTWGDLDEHGKWFEAYPNLYRDISTTAQHVAALWPPKEFGGFCTQYADRLLYATDVILDHRQPGTLYPDRITKKYGLQFEWLETANTVPTLGIGAGTPRTPPTVGGLNLPRAVLELIYWKNAARLIPHVREAMSSLGYGGVSEPEKPAPEATQRAQRLAALAPRVTERDIQSLSAADRAAVRTEIQRIARLTQ
jgi:hypothetical protein